MLHSVREGDKHLHQTFSNMRTWLATCRKKMRGGGGGLETAGKILGKEHGGATTAANAGGNGRRTNLQGRYGSILLSDDTMQSLVLFRARPPHRSLAGSLAPQAHPVGVGWVRFVATAITSTSGNRDQTQRPPR